MAFSESNYPGDVRIRTILTPPRHKSTQHKDLEPGLKAAVPPLRSSHSTIVEHGNSMSDQSSTQESSEETRSSEEATMKTQCWNGPMLAGMYNLPHHEASFSQDVGACQEYAGIISDCLDTLLVSI